MDFFVDIWANQTVLGSENSQVLFSKYIGHLQVVMELEIGHSSIF